MPTRLIDIGDGNSQLRLYETEAGDDMKYFALSHPWGAPPHFCTLTSNVERHRQSIDFNELPTTFKHAVEMTRKLGLRYLWIDSICIIQGPGGDFSQQASLMEHVFSQAYCVLAASSARSQRDGFLKTGERKPVKFECPGWEHPIYIREFMDDFDQDVLQSALNKRGWVLQERALARRTVYFTSNQTYWECGQGVRCETLTKMHKYDNQRPLHCKIDPWLTHNSSPQQACLVPRGP